LHTGNDKPITIKTAKGTVVDVNAQSSILESGDATHRTLEVTMKATTEAIGNKGR